MKKRVIALALMLSLTLSMIAPAFAHEGNGVIHGEDTTACTPATVTDIALETSGGNTTLQVEGTVSGAAWNDKYVYVKWRAADGSGLGERESKDKISSNNKSWKTTIQQAQAMITDGKYYIIVYDNFAGLQDVSAVTVYFNVVNGQVKADWKNDHPDVLLITEYIMQGFNYDGSQKAFDPGIVTAYDGDTYTRTPLASSDYTIRYYNTVGDEVTPVQVGNYNVVITPQNGFPSRGGKTNSELRLAIWSDPEDARPNVSVTAKTGAIRIQTTALTSAASYVDVSGWNAADLYGSALIWNSASSSYCAANGKMSVQFCWSGTTTPIGSKPFSGTYAVLINALDYDTDTYHVVGFCDAVRTVTVSSFAPAVPSESGLTPELLPELTQSQPLPASVGGVQAAATVEEGKATLQISATETAKASGNLTLDLSALSQPVTAAAIPVDTLAKLAGKVDAVTIALTKTAITLDAGVLDTVAKAGSGDVTLSVAEHDKTPLDAGAQTIIGDRPVYELSLKVGEKDIHELGGKATVSLPYTLKASEKPELMAVWRMVDGVPQPLECRYDAATGKVIFESETFSLYVVAYFPFADVPTSSWYYAPTAYAYMTGLMNGMGDYQFQPDFKLSRPMLATMLYGMEGKPAVSMSNPFSDLLDYVWYKTPVLWAAEQKLINGYYSNVFGVDDAVTREQMALILYNYATQKGYDVSDRLNLSAFKDTADISGWAQEAIRWAAANGLLSGRDDGTLDPKGQVSRAEVAAIMYAFTQRFVY